MIVTATPNPAWDTSYRVERLRPGAVHCVREVRQRPGGKGVNVASVLSCMGERSSLLLPLGGPMREAFAEGLHEIGLRTMVVESPVPTRRSVTVQDDGDATLLNEPGNPQPQYVWDQMVEAVRSNQARGTVLTISGSLPPQTPLDFLSRMVQAGHDAGMKVVLDCRGRELMQALSLQPELVRLNMVEAAATTGRKDQREAAQALLDAGAQAAAVSCGKDGVLLLAKGTCCPGESHGTNHQIGLRGWLLWQLTGNPTGAGDALTAALAQSLEQRCRPASLTEQPGAQATASDGSERAALIPAGTAAGGSEEVGHHHPAAWDWSPGNCRVSGQSRWAAVDHSAGSGSSRLPAADIPQQKPAYLLEQGALDRGAALDGSDTEEDVDAPGRLLHDWARALRTGVAWSAAAVLQPVAGVISQAHAEALRGDVVVEVLT